MMLKTLQLSEGLGQLSYRQAGSGPALVLIHGVGMQSAAWHPQIEALSKSHCVYALDMPGHGGSTPLPEQATLPDFVSWGIAAMAALERGPVNLAGHSMGALIAGGIAVTRPDLVTRVAVLNGVYRRDTAARKAVERRADLIRSGSFDLQTPLDRWFDSTDVDQAPRAEVAEWLRAMDVGGYATAYGAFARGDTVYADQFNQITCPFLALTGSDDQNSTPRMAQVMADTVARGTAEIIEGHRHMVNLTAPEAVNQALAVWLRTPTDRKESA